MKGVAVIRAKIIFVTAHRVNVMWTLLAGNQVADVQQIVLKIFHLFVQAMEKQ